MAWLRGSTDVANFATDIYNLLTGATTAGQRGSGQSGNGAQVTGTDAWTGLDSTNKVIRTKDTYQPWRLPIACYRGMPRFMINAVYSGAIDIGKPTFTGAWINATTRAVVVARVTTANTVAGTLAGTVVTYRVIDTTNNSIIGDTTISGWTGTTDTKTLGATGVSLTLTLNAGEQFQSASIYWLRGYATAYPQGIDYIPEANKIDTGQTITLSTTSNGSNTYTRNTDYKLVQETDMFPNVSFVGSWYGTSWAGPGVFSGIEWQAAAAPPAVGNTYYLVTCNVFSAYLQFAYSSQYFVFNPVDFWDATRQRSGNGARNDIYNTTGNVAVTTTGSTGFPPYVILFNVAPASTVYINYWISIKIDKIVIVFKGDPGNNGLTQIFTIQKSTALNSNDKNPWVLACSGAQALCIPAITSAFNYDKHYAGFTDFGSNTTSIYSPWGPVDTQTNSSAGVAPLYQSYLPLSNPNTFDSKWWFNTMYWAGYVGGKDTAGNYSSVSRDSGIRGKIRGIYQIANDNFANLDEIVDGSNTYLLVNTATNFGQNTSSMTYFSVYQE